MDPDNVDVKPVSSLTFWFPYREELEGQTPTASAVARWWHEYHRELQRQDYRLIMHPVDPYLELPGGGRACFIRGAGGAHAIWAWKDTNGS